MLPRQPISRQRSRSLRRCAGLRRVWAGSSKFIQRHYPARSRCVDCAGRPLSEMDWIRGALAGLAFVAGGTVTAHTGFSATSGWFLTPATVLLAVFVVGIVILMWRRSGRVEAHGAYLYARTNSGHSSAMCPALVISARIPSISKRFPLTTNHCASGTTCTVLTPGTLAISAVTALRQ